MNNAMLIRAVPVPLLEQLFDNLSETAWFIKDTLGRYTHVNRQLVVRCGQKSKWALIGMTTLDLFPNELGSAHHEQDLSVIHTGLALEYQLEMTQHHPRQLGWCITHKFPIREDERVIGLMGVSCDLPAPDLAVVKYPRLVETVRYIQTQYGSLVRITDLAESQRISLSQFERDFRNVLGLSPRDFLTKTRMDAAIQMLGETKSIVEIALQCGYSDHSSFSRHFRKCTGITPSAFRVHYATNGRAF